MSPLYYTVPWYPGLEVMNPPQLPGDGVRLMMACGACIDELGATDGEVIIEHLMLGGRSRRLALYTLWVAAKLGLVEMQLIEIDDHAPAN